MSIKLDDVNIALAIIEQGEGSEITLRSGDVELIIRRGQPGAAASPLAPASRSRTEPAPVAASAAAVPRPASDPTGAPSTTAVALRAPLTGVIYRAPSPGEEPFVSVGAVVTDDSVVCIIDVMKVMNLIKAPAAGRVVRIDAEDGQQVAKGDVVLWIEPN